MKRLLASLISFLGLGPFETPKDFPDKLAPLDLSAMRIPEVTGEMTVDQFWDIIAAAIEVSKGDLEVEEAGLHKAISALSPENVLTYRHHWDECDAQAYNWDLWAAAYIIQGGCSDDSFQDFRASLICQGRDRFEQVLKNPECLADAEFDGIAERLYYEGFQYVPATVYKEKTGEDMQGSSVARPADPTGDEWEEDDLPEKFPKLWKKFD